MTPSVAAPGDTNLSDATAKLNAVYPGTRYAYVTLCNIDCKNVN